VASKVCEKCGEQIVLLNLQGGAEGWFSMKGVHVGLLTESNEVMLVKAAPPHWVTCGRDEPAISDMFSLIDDSDWKSVFGGNGAKEA